jgi:Secretion system C-terminal sorting domain
MKTILLIAISVMASSAQAQDSSATIYGNGSASLTNSNGAGGYGFVGGLFVPIFLPNMGVVMQSEMDSTPLYPNPTTGFFSIAAPNIGSHIAASVYDERGAFVLDATPFMVCENDNFQFTLHGLSSGSYMLTLDDGKDRYSYKLSIRN